MTDSLDAKALEPCPHCGAAPNETPQNSSIKGWAFIWCEGCDAKGGECPSDADAITAWNRRSDAARPSNGGWKTEAVAIARMLRDYAHLDWKRATEAGAMELAALHARAVNSVDAYLAASPPLAPIEQREETEPVAWAPQDHLDFLVEGRKIGTPSSAIVHDRPNVKMGWIVPLFLAAPPASTAEGKLDLATVASDPAFQHGDRVRKIRGSSWQGIVVGKYSTALTPEGYCVESEREGGSVQIYPATALELVVTVASPPNTNGWQTVPVADDLEWENGEVRSRLGDLYSIHRLSENVWSTMINGTAFPEWKATRAEAMAVAQRSFIAKSAAHPTPTEKQEGDGA